MNNEKKSGLEPVRLPKPPPAGSSKKLFRITAGPDGDNLYSAIMVRLTDFETYVDVGTTVYKLKFWGMSGVLPSGSSSYINGQVYEAEMKGANEDGDPLWIIPGGGIGYDVLVAP